MTRSASLLDNERACVKRMSYTIIIIFIYIYEVPVFCFQHVNAGKLFLYITASIVTHQILCYVWVKCRMSCTIIIMYIYMIACVQVLLAQWSMINYQLVHPLLVLQLGLQIAREILKATLVSINYEDEVCNMLLQANFFCTSSLPHH